MQWYHYAAIAAVSLWVLRKVFIRLQLSKAKHPSVRGHAKMSRRIARLIPFYEYDESQVFGVDGAPEDVASARRKAFFRVAHGFAEKAPKTIALAEELESGLSDMQFVNAYRVPFQFRNFVRSNLRLGAFASESRGAEVADLDGNWAWDVTGSYGVNIYGLDFYKQCLADGTEKVKQLGPVLGPYAALIVDNVRRLKETSRLDEVSFHMSGTEAVMQAVRLARYHTRRSHVVRFCGAYHGWWDGVQPGVGNQRTTNDVYTLKDMSEDTLRILRTRKDIACVLVNPLQALHPNANPPGDATLISGSFPAKFDRDAYTNWLRELREICTIRSIVLIFDEVFLGFRLAKGGAQEYFDVKADIVTYGKSLGGGLPVGVVCGKATLMKRFRDNRPADVCFARGTFNSHPLVMATMDAFLTLIDTPEHQLDHTALDDMWNRRTAGINSRLAKVEVPVRVANLTSIWIIQYTKPGRYHWMFQFYLRQAGLLLSWIGTGRFIFPHNLPENEFGEIADRIITAAEAMKADQWWWSRPELTKKAISRQIASETFAAWREKRCTDHPGSSSRSSLLGNSGRSASTARPHP